MLILYQISMIYHADFGQNIKYHINPIFELIYNPMRRYLTVGIFHLLLAFSSNQYHAVGIFHFLPSEAISYGWDFSLFAF